MIEEYQKYRAEILRVAGFALMTPVGKLFLNMLELNFNLNVQFFTNLFGSLMLFILGVILLHVGYEEMRMQ